VSLPLVQSSAVQLDMMAQVNAVVSHRRLFGVIEMDVLVMFFDSRLN
jgi:hypothetical protein